MPGQDTTTAGFDAALKDVYLPGIREQLNRKVRLLNDFTKSDIEQLEWEGRQAIVALHKGRNSGVVATSEGGLIPPAGKQQYVDLKIPMRFITGRIQLTAQVIKASRSNKGSFARAMDAEQSGLVEDVARQRNRILAGAGRGILMLVNGGQTSATINMKNAGGVANASNPTRYVPSSLVGVYLAVYIGSAVGATLRFVDQVSSVTATSITFASSHTVVDGDAVTLAVFDATSPAGSLDLEPVGLLGIVDQTTYLSVIHGIDRSQAANAFFLSTLLSNVGTLTPDLIQRGIDNTEEISGEVVDTFYCHHSVRRELLKLHEGDRRYMGAQLMRPDVGTEAAVFKTDLTHATLPIKVDKDLPYGTLFAVSKPHLFWIPEVEGEWADEDGRILLRVSNLDSYEGRFRVFENFFSDKGNAHARYDGITATVTSGVAAL